MSEPPSPPLGARVTKPNGASGAVVPEVADHKERHCSTRVLARHEYPEWRALLPKKLCMSFSPGK
jgi:hypothetical protein